MSYRYRTVRPAPVINLNSYKTERIKGAENIYENQEIKSNLYEEPAEEIMVVDNNEFYELNDVQQKDSERGYYGNGGIIFVIIALIVLMLLFDF